jgi:hypothetical protein
MAELKVCCCGTFRPCAYKTTLFGITVRHTVMCAHCGRMGVGRTFKKAIEAWNRRADNNGR